MLAPCVLPDGKYIAIDRDGQILEKAKNRLMHYSHIDWFNENYSSIQEILARLEIQQIDRMIVDLGLSMFHLRIMERGFSFLSEEELDMRFNPADSPLSAFDVIHYFSESEISDILYSFGEEKMARRIAKKIVDKRGEKPIKTCRDLAKLIASVKGFSKGSHPATQSFQALRIYVNAELHHLNLLLSQSHLIFSKGALMAFITYHSIEDRIVKRFAIESPFFYMREKKPLTPSQEEISRNPAVRSAKLRVLVRS